MWKIDSGNPHKVLVLFSESVHLKAKVENKTKLKISVCMKIGKRYGVRVPSF